MEAKRRVGTPDFYAPTSNVEVHSFTPCFTGSPKQKGRGRLYLRGGYFQKLFPGGVHFYEAVSHQRL